MALGGGTFVTQNKVIPGSYMNFVSAAKASAKLSDRGVVTMPLSLDWGNEDGIFEVTNGDFQKSTMKLFGYAYTDNKMKGLRDLFLNAKTLYAYRLNGGGKKASNTFATAKYSGTRGNALKIVIQKNADNDSLFDVSTYMELSKVDAQTVDKASALTDNNYVVFKKDATLTVTASTPLAGGENGTVSGDAYQNYIDKIEAYSFNAMGVVVNDETTKGLFAAFNKRMRDEVGAKFQLILYQYKKADYMGTISVKNKVLDDGADEASLVYWVTGVSGGCAVNKSNQNKIYDGEFTPDLNYTQNELEKAIKAGEFTLHSVNGTPRVLKDINTLVSTTDECGDDFKDNQTVRVCDQIANDVAVVFATKYMGAVANINSGRTSLWSDLVKIHTELQKINAIESFKDSDITVAQGDTKKSVVVTDNITVVNAMSEMYMTVCVA